MTIIFLWIKEVGTKLLLQLLVMNILLVTSSHMDILLVQGPDV